MTDAVTTQPPAGQAPPGPAQPPAGQAPAASTQAPNADATQDGSDEPFDKVRAMATIRTLREQEKLAKTQAKELETLRAQVKQQADAQLSEADKLRAKVSDLERQAADRERERQERIVRYEVMLAAQKMNLVDADAAYRLLDLATLEFGEDGSVKDIEKALKELVKARPYLVKPTQAQQTINAGDGVGASTTVVDPKAREAELRQRFRM